MANYIITMYRLVTVIPVTGLLIIWFMLASSTVMSDEADPCLQHKSFETGVYGEFLYKGDDPRLYRVCVNRDHKRISAFVRFDSDELDFPNTEEEQACLEVEGNSIEVVTRIRRKHRGTYACLSCCDDEDR